MNRSLIIRTALLTIALMVGIFLFIRWRDAPQENQAGHGAPPQRSRGRLVTPADGDPATTAHPLATKTGRPLESQPHPTGKPAGYRYADKVPNRPGFVVSPFTGKQVDVRGMPAGTLVKDPTAPADMDKPHFRVPESAVNEPG